MSKVILLVDDDEPFRESVREILEIEGYAVIECADGSDALPILDREHIDLLLTDILMPEVDGIVLAFKSKALNPKLKMIGMTGGGRIVSAENVKVACGPRVFETILTKPFDADDLITCIKTL